ncbi:alpha/beta hydrolase [Gloeothece verrucosa]|uniref:DUF1400 domain-containing protein n=1 Tax=Gloeothece verrucosa (strain PCC 7822) TaxID=497965 RepID=E0UDL7_GLOV7|nr:alpha/beta hydrolase [Gloeothece verrucosa]ADN15330.1 protein of unknown function DUF1400 [Gloeothece verrucosa PCC 7822]
MFSRLKVILGSLIAAALYTVPVQAAEQITFWYPPFGEFEVSVDDLAVFAKEGKITPNFSFYAQHVTPKQLQQFRELLNQSFNVDVIFVSQLFNSRIGERLVEQLSLLIDNPPDQSQPALKGAIIEAAGQPQGLTLLGVLQKYPLQNLRLNTNRGIKAVDEAHDLMIKTERFFATLQQQAATKATPVAANLADLTQPGAQKWRKESLTIDSSIQAVVYLPEAVKTPAPLIVIAPGLNSDYQSLLYIAEHLASYGFGVAALNFPGSDSQMINDYLAGLATPPPPNLWVEQPKKISRLLDEIEKKSQSNPDWKGKLDLSNVGVLGQSLGGYTVTAIGGAQVNWNSLVQYCAQKNSPDQITFNLSVLLQCKGVNDLPPSTQLSDPRIKAVIAINPVTNPVFDSQGMQKMQVPVMLIGGSADIFAPPIPEQILPFSWLKSSDKYLLLVKNSTHFSFLTQGLANAVPVPEAILGPNPQLAQNYLKVLGVAFFKNYLSKQPEFAAYLTESYVTQMSQEPLPAILLKSFPETDIALPNPG